MFLFTEDQSSCIYIYICVWVYLFFFKSSRLILDWWPQWRSHFQKKKSISGHDHLEEIEVLLYEMFSHLLRLRADSDSWTKDLRTFFLSLFPTAWVLITFVQAYCTFIDNRNKTSRDATFANTTFYLVLSWILIGTWYTKRHEADDVARLSGFSLTWIGICLAQIESNSNKSCGLDPWSIDPQPTQGIEDLIVKITVMKREWMNQSLNGDW